jgi:hypothetical protein
MKKYIYILILLIATAIYSCKKETTLAEQATFASVVFNDPFDVFAGPNGPLKITYQGSTIEQQTGSGSVNGEFRVLAGEGKFDFFNSTTGAKVLTKKLNISKDTVITIVFFKPEPDAEKVELLENNQLSEPRPGAEDLIKVKIANFAQSVLGNKNIKIVFSQNGIPVDTIQTTGSEFINAYSEMSREIKIIRNIKRPTTAYSINFLDENNNPVLDANGAPVEGAFISNNIVSVNLYTIIVTVYKNPGQAPQIGIALLFEN